MSAAILVWLLASGAPEAALEKILAVKVVEPDAVVEGLESHLVARVPTMPAAASKEDWEKKAAAYRRDIFEKVLFVGEAARWRDAKTRVEWLSEIPGGPGYRIRKLRYEVLPGMWIPSLLYEPTTLAGMTPVVLNVNGHDAKGKAADYKQIRCINQAKRGMLALNVEWFGMGQLQTLGFAHGRLNQIDLCGASGLAPFYLAMSRGIDLLLAHPAADPSRVAVTGLSGGGWQTITISSLDPRVALANPVAGYSSFKTRAGERRDLGDSEQTPVDLATVADYAHMTALRAPRPTLLTYCQRDNCCFQAPYALGPLMEAALPIYGLYQSQPALRFHINHDPGTHNYERDNREAFYRMVGDFFYPGDPKFPFAEIPCEGEVKDAKELEVPLPADNVDFPAMARQLAKSLPKRPAPPKQRSSLAVWQDETRRTLAELLRYRAEDPTVLAGPYVEEGGSRVRRIQAKFGSRWIVAVVELVQGEPKGTAIVVADGGRRGSAAAARRHLQAGRRVLVVEPYFIGDYAIGREYLWALFVSAVGERPLGWQAAQVAGVVRWAGKEFRDEPLLAAEGPRSSAACLAAAALEPAIARLELGDSLGSLKEVLERNLAVEQQPELFCFGLLEQWDLSHAAAAIAPRPVQFLGASDRVRAEFKDLPAIYAALGSAHRPFD